MDDDLRRHARDLLADLADTPVPGADAAIAAQVARVARRAGEQLRDRDRAALLAAARGEPDPAEAAALSLAAALAGSTVMDLADDVATFASIAAGAATAVPNVALADPGSGPVTALLDASLDRAPAGRPERLTELFVAGTLARAHAREIPLDDALAAAARVERACARVDGLDVDDLLRHVYGAALPDVAPADPPARAGLVGGVLPLNVLQRITGGMLSRDQEVVAKGWTRAAAILLEVGRCAGIDGLRAADVGGTAARIVTDPVLLGRPETTITDLLTTVLGLQAAVALGGAGDDEPVRHLLARLVAHVALAE